MYRVEFIELNTELEEASDLTQGMGGAVPYHSFHRFVMNAMFPGEQEHPVLHPVRVSTAALAVREFAIRGFDYSRKILCILV